MKRCWFLMLALMLLVTGRPAAENDAGGEEELAPAAAAAGEAAGDGDGEPELEFEAAELPTDVTGVVLHRRPDGSVRAEVRLVEGRRDGRTVKYFENGSVAEEISYADNVRHGDYRSYYLVGGGLRREGSYRAGARHGTWRGYYTAGQLQEEVDYRNGERHGVLKAYAWDGVLREEADYRRGQLHGERKLYCREGRPVMTEKYQHGRRVEVERHGRN